MALLGHLPVHAPEVPGVGKVVGAEQTLIIILFIQFQITQRIKYLKCLYEIYIKYNI